MNTRTRSVPAACPAEQALRHANGTDEAVASAGLATLLKEVRSVGSRRTTGAAVISDRCGPFGNGRCWKHSVCISPGTREAGAAARGRSLRAGEACWAPGVPTDCGHVAGTRVPTVNNIMDLLAEAAHRLLYRDFVTGPTEALIQDPCPPGLPEMSTVAHVS